MSKDLSSLLIGLAILLVTACVAVGAPWLTYRTHYSDSAPHPQEAIWNR